MTLLPMFPLGSVLFPAMPLALRVFEERYLKLMGAILEDEPSEFGVVLIERGSEVGGGDKRFDIGTTAQVLQIEAPEGPLQVIARGGRRFRVTRWLEEDAYPQAEVEFLDTLTRGCAWRRIGDYGASGARNTRISSRARSIPAVANRY